MFGVLTGPTRRAGGTQGRRIGRGLFSPKQGNKNFYKGYGARSLGKLDSKARFHLDPRKVPEIVIPDLTDCLLKPYVAYATPKVKVAPFKAPTLDMAKCEVDLQRVLNPKQFFLKQKLAKQQAEKRAKEAGMEPAPANAPALEAGSSL